MLYKDQKNNSHKKYDRPPLMGTGCISFLTSPSSVRVVSTLLYTSPKEIRSTVKGPSLPIPSREGVKEGFPSGLVGLGPLEGVGKNGPTQPNPHFFHFFPTFKSTRSTNSTRSSVDKSLRANRCAQDVFNDICDLKQKKNYNSHSFSSQIKIYDNIFKYKERSEKRRDVTTGYITKPFTVGKKGKVVKPSDSGRLPPKSSKRSEVPLPSITTSTLSGVKPKVICCAQGVKSKVVYKKFLRSSRRPTVGYPFINTTCRKIKGILGKIYVTSTSNNTIITLIDKKGDTKGWISSGSLGFKNARKSTTYAAQAAAENIVKKAKILGYTHLRLLVKGLGRGKQSCLKALSKCGLKIISIEDQTGIPYNGCRLSKKRRV